MPCACRALLQQPPGVFESTAPRSCEDCFSWNLCILLFVLLLFQGWLAHVDLACCCTEQSNEPRALCAPAAHLPHLPYSAVCACAGGSEEASAAGPAGSATGPAPREYHTLTAFADGRLLLFGGAHKDFIALNRCIIICLSRHLCAPWRGDTSRSIPFHICTPTLECGLHGGEM